MNQNKVDYTNTFCSLIDEDLLKEKPFQDSIFLNWHKQWKKRLKKNKQPAESSLSLMKRTNPTIIPRNHKVEEVLKAANVNDDLTLLYNLLKVLKKPYENQLNAITYKSPPTPSNKKYQTFCGT